MRCDARCISPALDVAVRKVAKSVSSTLTYLGMMNIEHTPEVPVEGLRPGSAADLLSKFRFDILLVDDHHMLGSLVERADDQDLFDTTVYRSL